MALGLDDVEGEKEDDDERLMKEVSLDGICGMVKNRSCALEGGRLSRKKRWFLVGDPLGAEEKERNRKAREEGVYISTDHSSNYLA